MSEDAGTYGAAGNEPDGPSTVWIAWDIETGPQPREAIEAYAAAAGKPLDVHGAALRPETGRLLAVGYWVSHERSPRMISGCGEEEIIESFAGVVERWARNHNVVMVGHNTRGFDLPFLLRRAWIVGADPEPLTLDSSFKIFQCDTMQKWCRGTDSRISLAALAHLLGAPPKLGNGKDFATLLDNDPDAAARYLERDIEITAHVARRLFADCPAFERSIHPAEEEF